MQLDFVRLERLSGRLRLIYVKMQFVIYWNICIDIFDWVLTNGLSLKFGIFLIRIWQIKSYPSDVIEKSYKVQTDNLHNR